MILFMTTTQPESEPPSRPLKPHEVKRQLRALLAIAASYWQQGADASGAETPDAMWNRYLPILLACREVVASSPLHPDEARKLTSERRLNKALERLAGALKTALFGGDLGELEGWFVSEAVRERRRRLGLNRYNRAKAKARKRRKGDS